MSFSFLGTPLLNLRLVAFLLLVIVAEVTVGSVAGTIVGTRALGTESTILLQVSLQLLAAVLATAIMLRSIDARPWADVGMDRGAARPRVLVEGWLLGGLAIGAACAALLATGWLRIVPGPEGSSLAAAFSLTVFLIVAALGEELISRGYLLTTLRDGLGGATAVGVTSLLFGAALTVGGWALQRVGESQLGQQGWQPRPVDASTGDVRPGRPLIQNA